MLIKIGIRTFNRRVLLKINTLSIYGGTHGNEWTGVHLVENKPKFDTNLKIKYFLSNKAAIEKKVRYVEKDLNRSFGPGSGNTLEEKRALDIIKEIKTQDFVVDLHTTTSDMGATLIIAQEDEFTFKVAKLAQIYFPEIKIIFEPGDVYLVSRASHGVILEVGPCPQNTLKETIYFKTLKILESLVKAIDELNVNPSMELGKTNMFKVTQTVDFPRSKDGKLLGPVHDFVEKNVFKELKIGDPLFKMFDGTEIFNELYSGYPIFVNEAAYYEKGIAFVLTEKVPLN